MSFSDPWPVLLPALSTLFLIVLAVETVIALVKAAAHPDGAGDL